MTPLHSAMRWARRWPGHNTRLPLLMCRFLRRPRRIGPGQITMLTPSIQITFLRETALLCCAEGRFALRLFWNAPRLRRGVAAAAAAGREEDRGRANALRSSMEGSGAVRKKQRLKKVPLCGFSVKMPCRPRRLPRFALPRIQTAPVQALAVLPRNFGRNRRGQRPAWLWRRKRWRAGLYDPL